jgi:hypothetical protein
MIFSENPFSLLRDELAGAILVDMNAHDLVE